MPKGVKSRLEELEETVRGLSQKVERLESENQVFHDRIEKTDAWVVRLMVFCQVAVKRTDALEEKCSALRQDLDMQSLHLDAFSMDINEEEEKSLNSDNFIDELLQIQLEAPHIPNPPEPVQSEFTATMEVQGAPESESTDWKCRAQEMAGSEPGTVTPVSTSYSGPIMFLNTFSDEVPTKRPARDPVRRAGRPKVRVQQLMTPPEEPVPEQQVHEEELLVTEEQHTETISLLFESSSETFEFRSDDYDCDLFRGGNWV